MKKILVGTFSLFLLSGCEGPSPPKTTVTTGTTTLIEMEATEKNQERIRVANPLPELKDSLEVKNLTRRLQDLNSPNRIGYIYLINFGRVMAYYTIKGKISSLNSLITTPDQIVTYSKTRWSLDSTRFDSHVIASPDLDGSYGVNPEGIFFYTTEDQYVEWKGDYMFSFSPMVLSERPLLTMEIKNQ